MNAALKDAYHATRRLGTNRPLNLERKEGSGPSRFHASHSLAIRSLEKGLRQFAMLPDRQDIVTNVKKLVISGRQDLSLVDGLSHCPDTTFVLCLACTPDPAGAHSQAVSPSGEWSRIMMPVPVLRGGGFGHERQS